MKLLDRYTHFSFDLDGTLVHTIPEYRFFVVPKVVEELGGRIIENRDVDRFWFESGRDRIIKQRFGIDPEKFWDCFHKHDNPEERARHTFAYDDAVPTLDALRAAGKAVSIITGAPHYVASLEMEKLTDAPYDYFFSVYDSGFPAKPHPGSMQVALQKIGKTQEETVYIGNSNEDVYYAQNAEVGFIFLERKEHEVAFTGNLVAHIHSLNALLTENI
ncbi:MAG: HAD-IA family hydrolase [Patescibacteria group bacterium]